MNFIEHSDIFDLLSLDTGIDEDTLKEKMYKVGKKAFIDYLASNGLSLDKTAISFGSEVRDSNGKVLINTGVPVGKYLDPLLERYCKDDRFCTSPVKIACTSDILSFYREKSTDKVTAILENYIFSQDNYADFYGKIKNQETDVNATEVFSRAVNHMLSGAAGIGTMMKIFKNINAKKELLTTSINSSFISICIAPYSRQNLIAEESGGLLVKIALTCFLQDIANLMECKSNPTCIKKSEEIANSLINDNNIEEAIRIKHCFENDGHVPIFSDSQNKHNLFLRILVTVNQFLEIVKINKTDPGNLEVHKFMYELSELGYADKEVTSFLSRLFLPAVKHLVLQYAYSLKNSCSGNPVIWSTIGDMLPVKFICTKSDCVNAGQHKTYIPEDVKIEADDVYETRINAGVYNSCKLLTDKLQIYFKSISQKDI